MLTRCVLALLSDVGQTAAERTPVSQSNVARTNSPLAFGLASYCRRCVGRASTVRKSSYTPLPSRPSPRSELTMFYPLL